LLKEVWRIKNASLIKNSFTFCSHYSNYFSNIFYSLFDEIKGKMIQGSKAISLKFMKSLRKAMGTFVIVSLFWQNCLWAAAPSLILEGDQEGARAKVIKQLARTGEENSK
jgi:hypothetical protein